MITNLDNYLNEATVNLDYKTQSEDYWEQVNDTNGWKHITNELYDSIEEEGWVQDLTEKMTDEEYDSNRETVKSGFKYKQLELYYNWQRDHIKCEYDYTLGILEKFDTELKSKQEFPYDMVMFIDYDKGNVYIIKFKKPRSLEWSM